MIQDITQTTTISIYPESLSPAQFFVKVDEVARKYQNQPERLLVAFQNIVFSANLPALLVEAQKGKPTTCYNVTHLFCSSRVSVVAVKMAANSQIIPHNHPGMVGFMYLMQGKVAVTMWKPPTQRQTTFLECEKQLELQAGDFASLTPERGNYHSLVAASDTIFLDIFSPNYRLRYLPTYYRIVGQLEGGKVAVEWVDTRFKMIKRITTHKLLRLVSRIKN